MHSPLIQLIGTVIWAFVVVYFIVGIANDRDMSIFAKIIWVIFFAITATCVVSVLTK